jgi:cell wall-associated NlpC family hydrolase
LIVSGALWASALLVSGAYTPPNLHRVRDGENFATISRQYGIGYQRLIDANPELVPERIRPGLVILIPGRIEEPKPVAVAVPGKYRVQNGDTDWSIARRYGIAPSRLRQMNPGIEWVKLQIGQELSVPKKSGAVAKAVTKSPVTKAAPKAGGVHRVSEGENDWIIARSYGLTPTQLRSMNPGVDWRRLPIGTRLQVPGRTAVNVPRITTKRAKVIRNNVIVRAGARPDAARLTMVDVGRIAEVADRIGDWYKLKFSGGTTGWVRGDMLRPVSASMVASSVASESRRARSAAATRVAANTTRTRSASASSTRTRSSGGSVVAMASGAASSLLGTAQAQLGIRYRWGGTSRSGFDCSGFTTYVFRQHGKSLPRTSAAQSQHGQSVSRGELKKGDLVFFRTRGGSRVSHVGIYMGNGQFIHASSGSGRVRVNSLSDSYYAKRFAGARRVSGVKASSSGSSAKPSAPKSEIKETVDEQIRHDAQKPAEASRLAPRAGADAVGR